MGAQIWLVCTSPQWGGLNCHVLRNLLHPQVGPMTQAACWSSVPRAILELAYISIVKKFPKPSSAEAQPSLGNTGRRVAELDLAKRRLRPEVRVT